MTKTTTHNALIVEFARVFGSVDKHDGGLMAEGWPDAIRYDAAKAIPVLVGFDDGYGATEAGDAEVCAALEAAGAVIEEATPRA